MNKNTPALTEAEAEAWFDEPIADMWELTKQHVGFRMRIWDEVYQKRLEILTIGPVEDSDRYRIGYYALIYPCFNREDYTTQGLPPDTLISVCIDPTHNWCGGAEYEDTEV